MIDLLRYRIQMYKFYFSAIRIKKGQKPFSLFYAEFVNRFFVEILSRRQGNRWKMWFVNGIGIMLSFQGQTRITSKSFLSIDG